MRVNCLCVKRGIDISWSLPSQLPSTVCLQRVENPLLTPQPFKDALFSLGSTDYDCTRCFPVLSRVNSGSCSEVAKRTTQRHYHRQQCALCGGKGAEMRAATGHPGVARLCAGRDSSRLVGQLLYFTPGHFHLPCEPVGRTIFPARSATRSNY